MTRDFRLVVIGRRRPHPAYVGNDITLSSNGKNIWINTFQAGSYRRITLDPTNIRELYDYWEAIKAHYSGDPSALKTRINTNRNKP